MKRRAAGIISDHPAVDLVAAVAIAWVLAYQRPWDGLFATPAGNRSSLYSVLAEAGLGLLGLVAAALSIVKGVGTGARIERLRLTQGPTITKVMVAGLVGIGAAASAGLWAQIADTESVPSKPIVFVVYAALLLAGLRVARLIWVVRLILSIEDADTGDERRRKERPPLRLRPDEERNAS